MYRDFNFKAKVTTIFHLDTNSSTIVFYNAIRHILVKEKAEQACYLLVNMYLTKHPFPNILMVCQQSMTNLLLHKIINHKNAEIKCSDKFKFLEY